MGAASIYRNPGLLSDQLIRRPRQPVNLRRAIERRILAADDGQRRRRQEPQRLGNVQNPQHAQKMGPFLVRLRRIDDE